MRTLKEQYQSTESHVAEKVAREQSAASTVVQAGEIASTSELRPVLHAGKLVLIKIAAGVARLGRVMSGPRMSERDRFRYAANAVEIQKHSGIAASWPQFPPR